MFFGLSGLYLVTSILYFGHDITERNRAQEQEKFLSLLVENSLDLINVVNSDFTLLYASPSVRAMLGYAQEEFIAFSSLAT